MGSGRLRELVALLVLLFGASGAVVSVARPASAASLPGAPAGGCGQIHYKQIGGQLQFRDTCSVPPGSVLKEGADGSSTDTGCIYPNYKRAPDGTVSIDPDQPTGIGTWQFWDISDMPEPSFDGDIPTGPDYDKWFASLKTFGENADGDKVFSKQCNSPDGHVIVAYPVVRVPPGDPFWDHLPEQLAHLVAGIQPGTPTLAFAPGGPQVWGGFLTNAPYGVSLANRGIWHSYQAHDIDTMGAWHLTGIATPVSATVIVDRGHGTEEMDCDIGARGPVEQEDLPLYDPPTKPKDLPPCAFTARSTDATNVTVSMRITYRVVGFMDNVAQVFPDAVRTSPLETWPVVRTEAANTGAN